MIAGIKIELGGRELVVPPLNLRALIDLQDRLKAYRAGAFDAESISLVVECAHRALARNYPDDVTVAFLEEYIDLGNMVDVMNAVLDVSGLRRKKGEEEEAKGETAAG